MMCVLWYLPNLQSTNPRRPFHISFRAPSEITRPVRRLFPRNIRFEYASALPPLNLSLIPSPPLSLCISVVSVVPAAASAAWCLCSLCMLGVYWCTWGALYCAYLRHLAGRTGVRRLSSCSCPWRGLSWCRSGMRTSWERTCSWERWVADLLRLVARSYVPVGTAGVRQILRENGVQDGSIPLPECEGRTYFVLRTYLPSMGARFYLVYCTYTRDGTRRYEE